MSEVIPFPTPQAPEPKPPRHSGRQIWAMKDELRAEHKGSDPALDAKIHAVCGHLRRWERVIRQDDRFLDRCKRCPRYRHDEHHEQLQDGCYMLAEEFVALAICGDQYEPE